VAPCHFPCVRPARGARPVFGVEDGLTAARLGDAVFAGALLDAPLDALLTGTLSPAVRFRDARFLGALLAGELAGVRPGAFPGAFPGALLCSLLAAPLVLIGPLLTGAVLRMRCSNCDRLPDEG
jgi:hypothetical protein